MQAGKLRHRLTVEDYTETVDSYGEMRKTYSTTTTVWGSVVPLSGRELVQAQQVQSEATTRIRIRYTSLGPTTRIGFGTRKFDIVHVGNVEERNAEVVLLCKEAT